MTEQRIALICDHASPLAEVGATADSGGQNIYVAHLARHLARRGYAVDIYTRRDNLRVADVIEWIPGVRVIHVQAGPVSELPKEELLPHMSEFANAVLERMCFESITYAVIHANYWLSGLVAMHLKHWTQTPYVITFHSLGAIRRKFQGSQDRFPPQREEIERDIAREAAVIIAECPQDKADLLRHYNAPEGKMVVIPCGYEPSEFPRVAQYQARGYLHLPQDSFVCLQLGRMVPRKGIDTVIAGYAAFIRNHNRPLSYLLIVGGDKQNRDTVSTKELVRLQKMVKAEQVADRVIFTGAQPRHLLRYYYSAADVLLTTPWYEPFGLTPLEAMACGTPVIGSNVGGIKYTVRDKKTGWLIPPQDAGAVSNALAWFYENEEKRREFGENARQHVQQFSWEKISERIAGVYESVAAGAEIAVH